MRTACFLAIVAASNLGVAAVYGGAVLLGSGTAPFLTVFASSLAVPVLGWLLLCAFSDRTG